MNQCRKLGKGVRFLGGEQMAGMRERGGLRLGRVPRGEVAGRERLRYRALNGGLGWWQPSGERKTQRTAEDRMRALVSHSGILWCH